MSEKNKNLKGFSTFPLDTIAEIQRSAKEGIYQIRGLGAKRKVPNFDDLVFLGASASRYPLEGYREKCNTSVVIGDRFAKKPITLDIPITIAGMSFGALGANAKDALGRGASSMGTSTTTGDGGMTQEERKSSKYLVYQLLPSRYGMNPDDLRKADAIEVVVGQGAKPGGGGMLLGQKINERVAYMRNLPEGIDQRSACRHPDWTGPDDLEIKIHELRGKYTYVNFFATWNYKSLHEMEIIKKFKENYSFVNFFSINLDYNEDGYKKFLKSNLNYQWPICYPINKQKIVDDFQLDHLHPFHEQEIGHQLLQEVVAYSRTCKF